MGVRDPKPVREITSRPTDVSLPLAAGIAYRDLVFVSGMTGRDRKTGEIAKGDVKAQTVQAMRNIQYELGLVGTSLDRALKLTVFLIDMNLFSQMNEAYSRFFSTDFPARSCVGVTSLPDREALVEIEAIAEREA